MSITHLFSSPPLSCMDSVHCFGDDNDGDHFDDEDFRIWQSADLCADRRQELLGHPASLQLIQRAVQEAPFAVDLASGPSLGLIPGIRSLSPDFPCIATDANLPVLAHHAKVHPDVDYVQCSAFRLPFRDGCLPACTSYIGLSSTRSGLAGYRQALAEVHRTLEPGGKLYAIENEWTDVPAILDLFHRNGQRPYDCFLQEQLPWRDLFPAQGFRILSQEFYQLSMLRPEDNELGEMAAAAGVDVGLRFMTFIVEKA